MKTPILQAGMIYTSLGIFLSIAPALGQTPEIMPQIQVPIYSGNISDPAWLMPQPPIVSRYANPTPLTPEMLAIWQQVGRLTHSAALALYAGRYAEAEAEARQAVALEPIYGVPQEVLAVSLAAQGKDQEALQQYQTVVAHYDRQPRNTLPYALLLLESGQWAQALAVYNQALPNLPDVGGHPEDPVVHDSDLMQANNHFSVNVPDPAGLATAIHIAHGLVYNASCDWASESQNTQAMAEYQQALQLAPNSALTNYYYGQGWQQLSPAERAQFGTAAQAKAALQKASRIGKGAVKNAATRALQVAMRMR